ncbi:MAG: HYR domain-containing protein [Bacteroidota bacterium]
MIDTLPPMVVCPEDDVISVDGTCEVSLPDYRSTAGPTDNCSEPAAIALEQRPAPGTPLSGDGTTQTVTIIATDESGNVDSCQLTVTLEDSTEPEINCPADQELTADGDCEVVIPDYTGEATASSTCDQSTLTITQAPALGTTISGHNATETITLTATDASGNSVTCSFTVTLVDRTPPEITGCQTDTTGGLDEDCRYVLPNYWDLAPAAAQDNCRSSVDIIYTQSPPPGTVLEDAFTTTTITLTADDGNGNTSSCDFQLTLIDTLAPTIVCPADTVANPDADCAFALEDYTGRATVADNCTAMGDLVVTQSPPPGTLLNGQATSQEITLTVTDASGNSTACTFELVLQDTLSPTISCPTDKTEILTAACTFTVPDYTGEATAADNCTGLPTLTQTPTPGTVITDQNEGDSFPVTLTADDGNGNTASCVFTVTLDDVTAPMLTCAADSTVFVDATCTAFLPDLVVGSSATDNCGNSTITQSPLPGTEYTGDDTTVPVTLTADDGNGNTSQCLVTVTLQDTISPGILCPPNEVLLTDGDCEVMIPDYRPRAVATDNCTTTGAILISQDINPGTVLRGEGSSQIVTLTADDGNGNTVSCQLEVTVDDNVPPTIICPPTQTQFTDADCQVVVADYTGLAVTDDNCTEMTAITVTQEPAPGTVFTGVRNVTVTLTADDGNGNMMSCDFALFVRDDTPPQLTCPATQQVVADAACVAIIGDYTGLATATDNCTGGVSLMQSPPDGTTISGFDQARTVTITATDSSGNITTCDFRVELIDESDPTITCPSGQTLFADASCATVLEDYRSLAVGADNCDQPNTDLTYVQTPAAGLPLNGDGTTQEVNIEVTDRSGNRADCTFTVTVRDTISPTIVCPARDTIAVDQSCPVAIGDYTDQATVADNCAATVTVTQVPDPATEFSGDGTVIDVTLTANDSNGNTTSCTFQVELEDQTEPTIVCPGGQVLLTDADCAAVIPDYRGLVDASSPCGDASAITLTQNPLPNTMTLTGDSTLREITITATDDAQPPNSVSCVFEVILVDDTSPTITTCPPATTVFVNDNCAVELPDFRAELQGEDNCEAFADMQVAQTPVPGTVFRGDDTEVTLTFTLDDTNGNSTNCTSTVTLQDTISPTISCPDDQVVFTDGNCAGLVPDFTDAMVADNCTPTASLSVSQDAAPGTLLSRFNDVATIVLTVDDGNGNTTSCSFTVTLADDDPPTVTCPTSQTIDFAVDCGFTLLDYRPEALVDDNCALDLLTVTQTPSPDSLLTDLGTTQEVRLTVTDAGGNVARCVFVVTTTSPTPPPAADTVVLAVVAPPTGSGTVNLLDAFDPQAISNLSGRDLDAGQDAGIAPYTVSFYETAADATAEVRGVSAANYPPGDRIVVRIEDPATGCFVLSQITFDLRTPGTSGVVDLIHCNRTPFILEIDGLPEPGGMNTTIVRHEWRIISVGTTRLTAAQLNNADAQVISVDTEPLRSGTFVLEYQFFEDYGNGSLVPSVPKRVAVEVQNVGAGKFFWDGNR